MYYNHNIKKKGISDNYLPNYHTRIKMEYKLSDNTWDEKELEAIQRVIDSGFFSMGKEVAEYEELFSQKVGSKFSIMTNSGSSANLLAVAALCYSGRLKEGDEVIVPAVSWSTTYFPLAQYNLKLKFVDIDVDTLNIDVEKIKKGITKDTKAIMCVNLLGNPNKFDELLALCEDYSLILIEDNCESLGARYKGRQLGTFGVLGTYSTFYSHHLCTMEGGIVVTDDEELYHYMLAIRAHGWTRNLPKESKLYQKNENEFYESFNFIMPGYNLRPLEMEAAIGKEQLKKWDAIIEQRRKNAEYFKEGMNKLSEYYQIQKECEESSWFGFAIILKGELVGHRDELIKKLRDNEVEVRPIVAGNFTKSKSISFIKHEISGNMVAADVIHENGFFVGNHSKDNSKNVREVLNLLEMFAKGKK